MQSAAAVADRGCATPMSFHSTAGLTRSQKRENLIRYLCLYLRKSTQNKVVAEKEDNKEGRGNLLFKEKRKKRNPIKVGFQINAKHSGILYPGGFMN